MRKDLDNLTADCPASYIGIVAEAEKPQPPGDGLSPQPPVALQVPAVGGKGASLKAPKDCRNLPIAATAAGFVGDGQRCVNGHQPRYTGWDGTGDIVRYLVVVAQRGGGVHQPAIGGQNGSPRPVAR